VAETNAPLPPSVSEEPRWDFVGEAKKAAIDLAPHNPDATLYGILAKEIESLRGALARLTKERDEAREIADRALYWNGAVAVCSEHTDAIVSLDPDVCAVCEIANLREVLDARRHEVAALAAVNERLEKDLRIARKKADAVDRLPFCPDHRDKVAGKSCRECEVERQARELDALRAENAKYRDALTTIAAHPVYPGRHAYETARDALNEPAAPTPSEESK
jgi:hypothetical protein